MGWLMASVTFEVASYRYVIYTPGSRDYLSAGDGTMLKVRGVIDCAGANGLHCYVFALADDSTFPPNGYSGQTKIMWIYSTQEQFMWHVDMLRNEKPVYCTGSDDD